MTLGWPPPARGCRGNSPGWLPPNLWREPKAPLEPGQHGWLLGSATCAGAAPALRIQSSQLSPLGWEELNLSCFSRIASYSRASTESEPSHPQCHTTAPAWMASVGSLGRGCPPPAPVPVALEGRAGWPASPLLHSQCGNGWGHGTGRGGRDPVPSLPRP